jgi:transcription initiation factor TFIID TATA-box-binding protein
MVSVVNVVGAGDLGMELNLSSLRDDIDAYEVNYDEENYPGLYVRLTEEGPMVTLYRTGSYHISGAESEAALQKTRELLFERLDELGLDLSTADGFSVRNVVCVGNLEQSLNLNAIAIKFGLENVEYEPEQFPGLVYRPDSFDVVFLLFASGKVVITGSPGVAVSREAFKSLQEQLSSR